MSPATRPRSGPDRLRHKTVSAAVADALRQRILNGDLAPGVQLRQDALAEAFGISRIPIREALLQLEAAGLVRIVPHRGAVVAGLTVEEVEDIFQLRVQLEPQLLLLSAPRFSEADVRALHDLTAEYGAALQAGEVDRWGELNRRFHLDLLRHADRPRSLSIVSGLLQDCDRPTRLQLSVSGDVARADAEHTRIVALCEAGQIAQAADLLRAHIANAATSLVAIYRRAHAA
ncbi:GntR family transcriptional regulator [Methylobacterium sp. NEAU 140]|uniref:GntR family transcriptional regulator n=1 Tax=Methylobacterium sp. NEAU 140 TaxID=3064945 RepID=UPI002732FA45|nr:GntR family transcriptional regulator [Methylobacterium sp. NEAU 140]MDP4024161.1 GntR family transcriptional regulator [Methylobacterium sp. NEAU 140]